LSHGLLCGAGLASNSTVVDAPARTETSHANDSLRSDWPMALPLSAGPTCQQDPLDHDAFEPVPVSRITDASAGPWLVTVNCTVAADRVSRVATPETSRSAVGCCSYTYTSYVAALLPTTDSYVSVLAVAAMLAISAFLPLVGRRLRRTPLSTIGMVVAHFGVAVALAGLAAASLLTNEVLTAARPGERLNVGPWVVEFVSVTPAAGPNWTAFEAELRASRGSGVAILRPQQRFYTDPPTETTEAAIKTVLSGQLYTVVGKQAENGRWQLRLWWKPMVTLIWLGGGLIGLGGLLALGGRSWRGWRKERS